MSNGFHVLVFFEAKPGKAEALGRILADLIAPSRAEPACRYYQAFADRENANRFTVIEAWATPDDWQKHLQATHVANALEKLSTYDILVQPFTAQQLRAIG
jgi:quinol monooxygenase YgiN